MTEKILDVDKRGRANLAKVRTQQHRRYLVDEHPDGTLVLTPAVTITAAELTALYSHPEAELCPALLGRRNTAPIPCINAAAAATRAAHTRTAATPGTGSTGSPTAGSATAPGLLTTLAAAASRAGKRVAMPISGTAPPCSPPARSPRERRNEPSAGRRQMEVGDRS